MIIRLVFRLLLSDTAVGIMSLHTLVANTSCAILLRPTDNDFHAISFVVALDHSNFSCNYAMYRGSMNGHCNWCRMLLVIDIPRMLSTAGHDASKVTVGRYRPCSCWYSPAKVSASIFNCANRGNLLDFVVLS